MPLEFKTIAGVKVRYAHAARQDCPTVLLMNPLPQSIVAFAPLWDGLASHLNLYAYDLPGFGGSEGGLEYMTFETQGRFLNDFIAEFDIQSPHLVGPDVGMSAALAYVTHFPNEVAIAEQHLLSKSQNFGPAYSQCVGGKFTELNTVFVCEGTESVKAPSAGDIGNGGLATPGSVKRCPDSMQADYAKVGERSKPVRFTKSATQRAIA